VDLVYPPVIGAALTSFRLLDLRIRLSGTEHVPATGGAVLASNHVSYLDFIFAGLAGWKGRHRYVRFMAKDAVFAHRVSGPLMRGMHHIPVDRDAGSASYRTALRALKDGELVGIFPEATISRSFTVKEIKSGAVRLAASAKVPLLPVAVWGGQRLMTKGHRKDLLTRGRTVSIAVGEPVPTGGSPDEATTRLRQAMQALLDDVQAAHPDTADPGLDDWWLPRHLGGTAPSPEEAAELDAAERRRRVTSDD
jgi:1-acyl-sn-glycerol-3-phosphate acyltransferase